MTVLTRLQRQQLLEELTGLKRFCLSLTGDPSDADDLLQLTVERILERGMPEEAHVAKWAYRVCRNLWVDELRSRDVRLRYGQTADVDETLQQETDGKVQREMQLERVAVAIAGLPADQRAALSLVTIEGCSYAEAAAQLDVPVGTIMSRIARARKNLVTKLEWISDEEFE
jgi:RNA polymerase sigma-70 factor (ECF subfamily)